MPSDRPKFHRLEVDLDDKEYAVLSAEAYSREISRAELLRRALTHFVECQETKIEEAVKPPKRWRMPRPSLTA